MRKQLLIEKKEKRKKERDNENKLNISCWIQTTRMIRILKKSDKECFRSLKTETINIFKNVATCTKNSAKHLRTSVTSLMK